MNYVPSPGTRYRGIRRLMRDQRLNIVTGEVEHRPAQLTAAGSYQQAVDAVAEELTRAARVLRERTPGRQGRGARGRRQSRSRRTGDPPPYPNPPA